MSSLYLFCTIKFVGHTIFRDQDTVSGSAFGFSIDFIIFEFCSNTFFHTSERLRREVYKFVEPSTPNSLENVVSAWGIPVIGVRIQIETRFHRTREV